MVTYHEVQKASNSGPNIVNHAWVVNGGCDWQGHELYSICNFEFNASLCKLCKHLQEIIHDTALCF